MTELQRKKEEFVEEIEKVYGLSKDRWGHYKFKGNKSVYRVKMGKLAWRFENKVTMKTLGETRWIRIVSRYYTKEDSLLYIRRLLDRFYKRENQ